jgi:hypothetical protein
MAVFDYSTKAELSPAASKGGLLPTRCRKMRQPIGYGRFARAADAIRFAIEELPPELLPAAQLKVAEERFDSAGISPVVRERRISARPTRDTNEVSTTTGSRCRRARPRARLRAASSSPILPRKSQAKKLPRKPDWKSKRGHRSFEWRFTTRWSAKSNYRADENVVCSATLIWHLIAGYS